MRAEKKQAQGNDITQLLHRARAGEPDAVAQLMPQIYATLKRLAGHQLRLESASHTLTPTALVHEAYLQLFKNDQNAWPDRHRFYAYATSAMRSILIDHARAKHADKRGGGAAKVELNEALDQSQGASIEQLLSIDQALNELQEINPRAAKVVELKFFGGLSLEEIATLENLNERTVRRDWTLARAILADALSSD